MNHLVPGQIVDLARGLVPAPEADAMRPHLDGCDRCRTALDRLSLVARAARSARSIPSAAVGEGTAVAAQWSQPLSAVIRARLVFDNVVHPRAEGVRGGGARDRHILFEADQWAVDLRLVRRENALSIVGQLANAPAPTRGCVGIPVLVWNDHAVVGRGLTGAWGEFTITCADVAPLTLEIRVSELAIAIGIPPAQD
jgi:hypothetical protein